MQITLEVTGESLKRDVADIMASLTEEDKRHLAAQIAHHYFLEEMEVNFGDRWGHDTGAMRYVKDLVAKFKETIGGEIKKDPDLWKTVTAMLEAVKEEYPKFVATALEHAVTKILIETLQTSRDTSIQLQSLADKLNVGL